LHCQRQHIVREHNATPATIAVLNGQVRIGLGRDELAHFATSKTILKLSRADLPYAVARGLDGATTVAATMICAHLAGIRVFATGGIGGVHRGAESSMDISADLEELARTPVTVVCAGAKALLDLGKTLEVLETRGVPVIGFGTDEFPAFWSCSTGLPLTLRADTVAEIAAFVRAQRDLGLSSGLVVANPVDHQNEIPREEIEPVIASASEECAKSGISGKAITPWILDRILAITGGRSLDTNIALVKNNARLAAEIAVALAHM
jgi:pseudouridine-5'-phosphate glycosidase